MVSEVVIANPENLEEVKKKIAEEGKDKIHVLADFDRTLTRVSYKGERVPSLMAVLRDKKYLTEDYPEKARALAKKYYPMEIDLNLPHKEKEKKMLGWWTKHNKLLIEGGLNKKDIENVANSETLVLMEGVENFLRIMHEVNVPVMIMSSSGLGDAISIFLEKRNLLFDNIHIITNQFEFDNEGRATELKGQVIHVMNKSEISTDDLPIHIELLKRKNVILLGDSLGDLGMVEGFEYDNLVNIGFLNFDVEEALKKYKENFDVVITNDGDFNFVNKLLNNIIK